MNRRSWYFGPKNMDFQCFAEDWHPCKCHISNYDMRQPNDWVTFVLNNNLKRIQVEVLATYQALLNKHAEQNGIANFPETLEDFCPQIRILDHVVELGVVVAKYPGRAVVVPEEFTVLRHDLHQRADVLHQSAL